MMESYSSRENLSPSEQSLEDLAWAISMSEGEFSLIWVHCNYALLQQQMVRRLRQRYPEMRTIVLEPSVTRLYATIREQLGDEPPSALMVLGIESVREIKQLLSSMNSVREEFRQHCPFPVLIWINDSISQQLTRIAPDLKNWGTLTELMITPPELQDILHKRVRQLFKAVLNAGANRFLSNETIFGWRYLSEIKCAIADLKRYNLPLSPELEACWQFVQGRDAFVVGQLEQALTYYQKSLDFWEPTTQDNPTPCLLERQGVLLFHIGLCYSRTGKLCRSDNCFFCEEALPYLQECLERFKQAQRQDLVAKFSNELGKVLRQLKDWDKLQKLANQFKPLHERYGMSVELAQDYSFLAEVALNQYPPNPAEAKELSEKAMEIVNRLPSEQQQYRGLHLLVLAQSLRQLGQIQEALETLEAAKNGDPEDNPQLYIQILEELRSLYFEQQDYLQAFEVKQYQRSIEQQFGFRAFIGAGNLQPQRQPKSGVSRLQKTIAPEIIASGRERDVKHLIARMGNNQHQLTVICGPSGVGKSSLVNAGLIPELKRRSIGIRDSLPVLLRVYTDWCRELGQSLAKALDQRGISLPNPPDSTVTLLEALQRNEEDNLFTVLIFDQFEEFFFASTEWNQRQLFFEFIAECLRMSFVKVILSIREDYIHYLLPCNRLKTMAIVNKDVLGKTCLYTLGNLSPEDAKNVIHSLTESSAFSLESYLIDEIVRELSKNQGEVRPIELQIVGAQLQAEGITTLAQYKQFGSQAKQQLVQRYLESVVQDCGSENDEIAWLVLFLLTDENKTRPLKTQEDLKKEILELLEISRKSKLLEGFRNNFWRYIFTLDLTIKSKSNDLKLDKTLKVVLQILQKSGLVFLWQSVPDNHYQLVHDYLVAFIRQKFGNDSLEKLQQTQVQLDKLLRRQLRFFQAIAVSGFAFMLFATPIVGWQLRQNQKRQEITEIQRNIELNIAESERFLASNQKLNAIRKAFIAWKMQQYLGGKKLETKPKVEQMLQRAVSDFKEYQEYNNLEDYKVNKGEKGHKDAVIQVAFSPDGKTIATASFDHTVKLWQPNGKLIHTIQENDKVNSLAFSPDGKLIATASFDNTVKLWKLDGSSPIRTFQGHSEGVFGVAFSPDSKLIATASGDKTIKLWNPEDGTLLKTLTGHEDVIDGIAFSPNGEIIASASWDGTVKLWRTTNEKSFRILKDETLEADKSHSDRVFGVAFSPDGKMIASVSRDNTAKLWNTDGTLRHTLNGHTDRVIRVDFSPDGETMATTSWDKTIKVWRTTDGTLLETLEGHTDGVFGVEFSPDGEMLATASQDNTVKLWKRDKSLNKRILKNHSQEIHSIDFSSDGKKIATASEDSTVNLWKTDGTWGKTLPEHQSGVYKVVFSPDGTLIATASWDKTVKIWQADGTFLAPLKGQTEEINSLAFSPDNRILATANKDRTVKLWTLDGTSVTTLKGHRDQVQGIAFSPDGQMIATASWDDEGRLWNRDGESLAILNGHSGEVNGVAFSPDGQIIATVGKDKTVRLWNRDGEWLETLYGHTDEVNGVVFSPDGQMIATMSKDKTVKVWNQEGELLHTLSGLRDFDWQVRFTSENQLIASAINGKTLILWNVELLQPNQLIERSCDRLRDYLQNNPSLDKRDRSLCDGIGSQP
ncbi:WD40 domain-containing protein [Coleofasciculus sp.]|uniref:WD40 domain-containing protein n=1 Tax=Coleofasciculus sp. TaxID=3100458 RepID=UPI003A3508E4